MGSLMAGWDSPLLESKKGRVERHGSFTRDEIDNFWRLRRELEDEHFKEAVELTKSMESQKIKEEDGKVSSSEKATLQQNTSIEKNLESMTNFKDWWTKSSWAFLNDASVKVMEAPRKSNPKERLTGSAV